MPEHAVIIPHYNDVARLARLLDCLVPQRRRLPDPAGTELLVVDNGSTVDLGPLRAAFPEVRFVVEERKGAAHARNRGVAESHAEALFFIDSDCVPAENWLETAIAVRARAPVIGGRVELFDERPPPRSGAEAMETVFGFRQDIYIRRKGFSVTANLLTSRRVFEAVGGFREGVSEDMDWCFRAGRMGFRIAYADDLVVSHPTRPDWPALVRKTRRVTEETYGLEPRGPAGRAKWALRALGVIATIPLQTVQLLASQRLCGPGERLRGAATLVGIRALRSGWMLRQALTGRAALDG